MTHKIERPAGRTVGRVLGGADSEPYQADQGELELLNNIPTRALSAPSKIRRVLSALADGHSLNRFEALRDLRDSCLNSTVSELQIRFGLEIYREVETISGYGGCPTRVCRYSLSPDMRREAHEILQRGLR